MKYMKQFAIIITISFLGEGLRYLIPLPIPASVYGLVIMLLALITHILPIESVKEAGGFLIEIMPLMFIPAAVGLMNTFTVLKPILIPVVIITVASTILVMIISGRVTQSVIRSKKMEKCHERDVK